MRRREQSIERSGAIQLHNTHKFETYRGALRAREDVVSTRKLVLIETCKHERLRNAKSWSDTRDVNATTAGTSNENFPNMMENNLRQSLRFREFCEENVVRQVAEKKKESPMGRQDLF